MGRTLQTIYNELTASKEANTDLDNLLPNPDNWQTLYTFENFKLLANTVVKNISASLVDVWRLIMYVVAYAIYFQEQLYDTFKSEIDDAIANKEFAQLPWYVDQSELFQFGDQLEWIDSKRYGYSIIDEDKRIITQAAATVSNGAVLLKIAKGTVGSIVKLTTAELTAFTNYMKGSVTPFAEDGIAPPGTKITIISEDADQLRFASQVFYDPQVLDSSGALLNNVSVKPVEVAITNYIQQIPFDSKFRVSGLIDAIQSAQGVVNIVVTNCDAKTATQAWSASIDVINESGKQYVARAGYLEMGTDYELDGFYDFPTNLVRIIQYISE
jgi:hypothetical protein